MSRSRATARAAGAKFERLVADYLNEHVSPFIDRRVKTGARDKGDVANVRAHGEKVVIEAKDYGGKFQIGPWLREAEIERCNDMALAGLVIAKRRGTQNPGEQVVLMTVDDFVALLTGRRV